MDWIGVQNLSRNENDEEGGQYKTDVQCLAWEYGELREIAIEQGFPS